MDEEMALTETLVKAIQQDIFGLAKLSLEQGANPNLVLSSGISPFHLAIGTDSLNALPLVKLFLHHNGNPNVRSVDGMTPVHVAATWGRCLALQLLLANGGNPELYDEDGANAMDMAKENKNWDCLNILRTYQIEEAEEDSRPDNYVTRFLIQQRSSFHEHPDEGSSDHLDLTDLNHNSSRNSLDSTALSSYCQDVSFSPSSHTEEITNSSQSFFPDLASQWAAKEQHDSDGSGSRTSEPHEGKPLPAIRQSRGSSGVPDQACLETTFPDVMGLCDNRSADLDRDDCPVTSGDGSELAEEQDHNKTLSNKYLEELLMSEHCTGLDLTSPDHPSVFIKVQTSHNGETPPLDKTMVFLPDRRSVGQSGEVKPSEISLASEEGSAYVTCQSDDIHLSCTNTEQQFSEQRKRHPRRVTFSDEGGNSTNQLIQRSSQVEVARERHVSDESDPSQTNGNTKKLSLNESSENTCELSDLLTSDNSDSDLLTTDESSFIAPHIKPTCQFQNELKQLTASRRDAKISDRPVTRDSSMWQLSSGHPTSRSTEGHSIICEAHLADGLEPDCNTEHDSVEYLYHDEGTGAMLIERQCPSALTMNSSHLDVSYLEYSQVSTSDETVLYDWRDYQTDDEGKSCAPAPLSKELLELTDKGIREMMQKYGEEAGPITSTTRMVYLHHLAKLQNDPGFAGRTANRQQTFQGFRWELAEYLRTGNLPDSEQEMGRQEHLMVVPFQNPDPSRKWREGTLKSSFNYLLLDPRVTKDLPSRYNQLTQLEAFRVFVAAIFYIGKGKRSRPYAHFYEALSHRKLVDEVKDQTPKKTSKKQANAKVRHILDIWAAGLGVVSLHCFQSVIPVEAYTREVITLTLSGLSRLTNIKKGDFYGPYSTLPARKRRQMGVFLLKKACQIFLVEGERQIRPADIALGQ
ncbi:uncharacterized protein LOC110987631 [Acanthaster planci]|uniref:Uncharacterized protein LOC110987631 n=1 Tax=Acanthaster planci TaxID=133434 RepID=A0A8B7ZRY3_ACAPL|nr:uncharacterized protein LOC110987631 [Acanthaster planci]